MGLRLSHLEDVAGNAEAILGKRSDFGAKLLGFVFENALGSKVDDVFFVEDAIGFYLFVVAMERDDFVNCVTVEVRGDALCLG